MSFSGIWVDLKIVVLNYVSQKEEDKYHDTSYMQNLLKSGTNVLIYKAEKESQVQNINMFTKEKELGRDKRNWG